MYRIGQEEVDAVARVIETKHLFKTGGKLNEVRNFELELAEKLKADYTILMTSGKAALISALIGMGIGPGDEVIVPGYTYIATALAVVAVGAIPVIADIDDSLTLDPIDAEKKITERTKCIIPVHIQGFPSNMDAICALAKKYNLFVLEDACQADGGSYKGKRLGTCGDAGAFSFNHFKIISAGEGGAVVTSNRQIFERAFIYHDSSAVAFFGDQLNGVETESFCGNEYRANEVMGAILREQLKKLDDVLADLRRNKKALMDRLAGHFQFAPSNDIEGDCGTTIALKFDTIEEAAAFEEKKLGGRPINTGRHVYSNWTPIIEKRGAVHPLFDPFKMEANKNAPDYSVDMCPKTLEILSKNVYVSVKPDWTEADIDELAQKLIAAK